MPAGTPSFDEQLSMAAQRPWAAEHNRPDSHGKASELSMHQRLHRGDLEKKCADVLESLAEK